MGALGSCSAAYSVSLWCLFILSCSATSDSLLWGPYRPNLYFGIRPQLPHGLATGLLWSRVEDFQTVQQTFRYTCETGDNMAGYGWEEYDARNGGRQVIHDQENKIDITTEFVKVPGGGHGGNWGARITGKPRADGGPELRTTVVFAVTMEGNGSIQLESEQDHLGYEGDITFRGRMCELGDFKLDVTAGPKSNAHPEIKHSAATTKPLERTFVNSLAMPADASWQTKAVLFQVLKDQVTTYVDKYGQENIPPAAQLFTITNGANPGANVHLVQKVFEGAFEFDVLYSSASAPTPMTSEELSRKTKSTIQDFDRRYEEIFARTAPFEDSKYDQFSKALFSNLLGGVGYFYGDAFVDKAQAPEYDEEDEGFWQQIAEARQRSLPTLEGPYQLLTAVPSRPFFPRGFLWDEGFHLLPILDWDADLTLEILKSWFSLMDSDGWIAREQILGAEARSKVPVEFQVQLPQIANPPTLFLVLESLLDKMNAGQTLSSGQKETYTATLRTLYPALKKHYSWYRKTQKGDIKSYDREAYSTREAYRWRGRTPTHVLASGLDDYPRSQPPHPGELHVDLMSWMGMLARSMQKMASTLGEQSDASEFAGHANAIQRNLDDLHWSEAEQAYCDASIDQFEEDALVCHKGYISLFPFMTSMMPRDSPKLGAVLNLIANEDELWSPHGICSLSKKDPLYGTGENYWRSPVWMNMNYLILTNLQRIAQSKGAHQKQAGEMYTKLRKNLVETVYEGWKETGFAWEQYNPDTGKGQRTAHFTGWTSLVVKMMCLPDLGKADNVEHGEL